MSLCSAAFRAIKQTTMCRSWMPTPHRLCGRLCSQDNTLQQATCQSSSSSNHMRLCHLRCHTLPADLHAAAGWSSQQSSNSMVQQQRPSRVQCYSSSSSSYSNNNASRHRLYGSRTRCYSRSSSSSSSIPPLPVVYHPLFSAPQLPASHRFPMQVFRVIYERLLSQGIIHPSQVHTPEVLPTDAELSLVHCPDYLAAFSSCTLDDIRVRRIGFGATTRTPILVDRTKSEVAGTLLTAQLALQHGLAVSTAGGTHHAFAAAGSGFCILNDLAYTAHRLQQQRLVERILILDLDVHQGDGTAAMCADNPNIFTLSVHAASNFPARKQRSSLDVALPDGLQDEHYLQAVAEVLPGVLSSFRPQLVLYDAGVDIHEADDLGRLAVSDAGMMRRELLVLDSCLGSGIPVAGYVGGGYDKDLHVLAERHMVLHRAALRMWTDHGL